MKDIKKGALTDYVKQAVKLNESKGDPTKRMAGKRNKFVCLRKALKSSFSMQNFRQSCTRFIRVRIPFRMQTMAAYVVVEVQVHDQDAYAEYKAGVPATLAKYDGKFLVRGGKVETLEGGWLPERFVLLEFPSVERAKEWWASPEYSAIKDIRYRNADSRMFVVEGVA